MEATINSPGGISMNVTIRKKPYLLITALLLMALAAGCSTGAGTLKYGSELNTPTKMSMSHEDFIGHKETQVMVLEGQPVVVTVSIITEKGTIDAYIAKDNNKANSSYEGHDIKTSTFTVTLKEPGQYTIRVEAKNHSGSYSFSW